jgi:hypothetical protein
MSSFGNKCPADCPTAKAHFDEACARREYPELEHLLAGLGRFFNQGIATGHFLDAVLSNDLVETIGRGDPPFIASACLPRLVQLIYNHAPADAWGSPERVETWRARVRAEVAGSSGTTVLRDVLGKIAPP